jgi:predicted nuclease with RNAse H fold
MQTVGIDLATEPPRTAVCTVSWDGSTAVADFLTDKPATDEALVAACRTADKVGIDCPFGWPEPFVAALVGHRDQEPWPGRGVDFRRSLAYRETDRHVQLQTGAWPLSVSANLIGLTAMRCAALLDDLAPVDRAGTGRVAEVYPAAALRVWELWRPSYKQVAGRVVLGTMLDGLQSQLPLQFAPGAEEVCRRSHDAFDALIAALVARAAACGLTTPPQTAEQRRLAGIEGWIHLPTGRLRELTGAERDTGA